MSWPAARNAPSSEYLLADDQPAMSTPITESDDTASAKKMPDVEVLDDEAGPGGQHDVEQERREDHDERRQREDPPVGLVGDDVLLLDELHPVGDELQRAVGPGLHGPEPALHVAHHLQQEHVAQDDGGGRDDRENDTGLERRGPSVGRDVDGEHQRSMSPRMKYRLARMVMMSGT